MAKVAIRTKDLPHWQARLVQLKENLAATKKSISKVRSFGFYGKKYKDLTPEDKDSLLEALALRVGLLLE